MAEYDSSDRVRSNPHAHPFGEILYVAEGTADTLFGEEKLTLNRGMALYYPPELRHAEYNHAPGQALRLVLIGVQDCSCLTQAAADMRERQKSPAILLHSYQSHVERKLAQLLQEASNPVLGSERMCSCCCEDIVITLCRICSSAVRAGDTKDSGDALIPRVKAFLDENYVEDLNLSDIAGRFYVSKDYLSHVFKQEIGNSMINYVIRKRMETAKELLEHSSLTVSAIGLRVGYTDQNYFSLMFKRYVGVSPSRYRLECSEAAGGREQTDGVSPEREQGG